jgi:Putative Actinobacterial Holin-X, holin superfamily III
VVPVHDPLFTEPAGARTVRIPPEPDPRSTLDLVRDIATNSQTLVRKEVELAKQEVLEAIMARVMALAALIVAGLFGFFVLLFGALAAAAALDLVLPAWAAALIVAGGFLLLAVPAVLIGMRRMKAPSLKPEETVRTVKEDVEWARAQLKR